MKLKISQKRSTRVRRKLKKVNIDRFRLSVHRSAKNLSAQIIDDKANKTIVSASSIGKKESEKVKKSEQSSKIAEILISRAKEKKITKVYFDKGKYKYHGRIKKFADLLREKGLIF